jgi:hypothetical protein
VGTLGIGWLQLLSHCITSRGVIRNARLSAAVKLVGVCLQQMLRLGDDAARELEQQAKTALHFHRVAAVATHGVSRSPMGNGQRGLVESHLFLPANGHQGINRWQALGLIYTTTLG